MVFSEYVFFSFFLIKVKKTNSEHVLIRELEEALRTTTAVLGTLAFEAVGEEHGKTAHAEPLLLTRGDELIDDDLGTVAKVTELGLPDDEAVGALERVTVFEAKDSVLREGAVDDVEVALVGRDVLEGSESPLGLLAVDDGVTVVEGSTLAILSGKAHVVTLSEERTKGKSLSESPFFFFHTDDEDDQKDQYDQRMKKKRVSDFFFFFFDRK